MRTDSTKIILTRNGVDNIWKLILNHYDAHGDDLAWKYLAMLALREDAGWPLKYVGRIFGHHKGHAQRAIEKIKREIRDQFELSPEWRRRARNDVG